MVYIKGVPWHPSVVGVMVIVTVPCAFVELNRVITGIGLDAPLGGAPEIPVVDDVVQEYVVKLSEGVMVIACVEAPEHIV